MIYIGIDPGVNTGLAVWDGPCFIGRAQEKHYDDQPAPQPRQVNVDSDLPF